MSARLSSEQASVPFAGHVPRVYQRVRVCSIECCCATSERAGESEAGEQAREPSGGWQIGEKQQLRAGRHPRRQARERHNKEEELNIQTFVCIVIMANWRANERRLGLAGFRRRQGDGHGNCSANVQVCSSLERTG